MKTYRIAVIPLDGVGKQLIPLGASALRRAQELVGGFELDLRQYEAGFEYYTKNGRALPEGFEQEMEHADAMFCGSTGRFSLEVSPADYPEFRTGQVVGFFRRGMGNTIGLRPLRLMEGVESPLRHCTKADILLVRELGEGGYMTPGTTLHGDVAYDVQIVTRAVTERLALEAFSLAQGRNGRLCDGQKTITVGVKQGAVACLELYRTVFSEAAAQYPQITLQFTQIDALAEQLIKEPTRFDVIVCENMLGDIIGDIGACITGGMGIAPTADVGGRTPHFRPNHGTFPRAAGKNFANPTATLLTAALMLQYLANRNSDPAMLSGAALMRRATAQVFKTGGPRTKDMGGQATTEEAVEAVCRAMEKLSRE